MTSECIQHKKVPVYDQTHLPAPVIHKPHRRHRSGAYPKICQHLLFRCERKSRASELGRKIFRLEDFAGRNHKQIEICLLAVAEKKVLAYRSSKMPFYPGTDFHCVSRFVVNFHIVRTDTVKQPVYR